MSLPSPHPAVVAMNVPDGAVLLHTEQEIYFGLNAVGARVWELLPQGCADLDELCARLAEHYPEVEREVIRADVEELLAALQAGELVV